MDLNPRHSSVTALYHVGTGGLVISQDGAVMATMTLAAGLAGRFTVTTDQYGGSYIQLTQPTEGKDALALSVPAVQAQGLDGSGILIGVISGNFNSLGGMAQDILNGDLPADTTILSDTAHVGDDEGRAMAQLIHKVAPGASIIFADDQGGYAGMAANIDLMVQNGVKVIVDDVEFLDEPFWQPGDVLDQAIAAATRQGVIFLTAAGNSGKAYYSHEFDLTSANLPGGIGVANAFDFSLGNGDHQYLQRIDVANSGSHSFALQWDEPVGHVGYTLTLHILQKQTDGTYIEVGTPRPLTNGVAGQITGFSGSGEFYIAITGDQPDAHGVLKYKINNNGKSVTIHDDNAAKGAGDISGHRLNPDEITVGEIGYQDTPAFGAAGPLVNSASSDLGPGQYLFDAAGNRLVNPPLLNKPDVTGAVGSGTDVSGTLTDFSGTSAAAPNVAGVVALMLQVNRSLTTAQVKAALQQSALPMEGRAAGAGLVQAPGAVLLATTPTVAMVDTTNLQSTPLHAGDVITLRLTTSVAMTVTAAPDGSLPTLTLSDGGTAAFDAAASSGTSLVFHAPVTAGQHSRDLTVTTLELNGATLANPIGLALATTDLRAVPGAATNLVVDTATHAIDLYDGYADSILIPFVPGSGIDSLTGPDTLTDRLRLSVSVNGNTAQNYVIDTGSLGVTVPGSDFTAAELAAGRDGSITYGSSNIELVGKWVTTTLAFTASGGQTITETLQVLAVTSVQDPRTGAPLPYPVPRMLGVKYAPVATDPTFTVADNPFLNLPGMQAGTMRAGYTITEAGVTLGLTAADAGDGWAYGQLQPAAAGTGTRLWQPAVTTITAAGGPPTQGTELIDTGLTRSFINGSGSTIGNVGQAGTPIAIDLLGTGTGTVGYAFTVGGTEPWTPSEVQHVATMDFINTGSRALLAMDYLVDATGGFIGFRAKPGLGPNVSFTPVLALGGQLDPVQAFKTSLPVILRDGTSIAAGTVVTLGAVSGTHGLTVSAGATLSLSTAGTYTGGTTLSGGQLALAVSGAAGTGTIAFAAGTASTLAFAAGATPGNAVTGLDADDVLDFQGFDAATSTASYDGTTLRVTDAAGHAAQLTLAADPTTRFVRLAQDASGTGVAVSFDEAPCYCPGTLILTSRGETPVEDLAIGDHLVTGDGTIAPIVWIGRRSYAGRFVAGRPSLLPIRIRAGALGDGLPRRDLLVSPLHAMLLDGHLVPAGLLVNGCGIQRVERVDQLDYIHLELPHHAVIWAEGAASESFLDDGSRGMFHNAAEHAALYPDAPAPGGYCAPRLEGGQALIDLRRRLAGLGHAVADTAA